MPNGECSAHNVFCVLGNFKVTLWSFWSRQLGGYFLLDTQHFLDVKTINIWYVKLDYVCVISIFVTNFEWLFGMLHTNMNHDLSEKICTSADPLQNILLSTCNFSYKNKNGNTFPNIVIIMVGLFYLASRLCIFVMLQNRISVEFCSVWSLHQLYTVVDQAFNLTKYFEALLLLLSRSCWSKWHWYWRRFHIAGSKFWHEVMYWVLSSFVSCKTIGEPADFFVARFASMCFWTAYYRL